MTPVLVGQEPETSLDARVASLFGRIYCRVRHLSQGEPYPFEPDPLVDNLAARILGRVA